MIPTVRKGNYTARIACDAADLRAAQALRHRCFIEDAGLPALPQELDIDPHDGQCHHVLVENQTGDLVCTFRMMPLEGGGDIGQSYSAQYYDLDALSAFEGRMVEMGRFCIQPELRDPDVLRIAWGAMTRYVDEAKVEMLFGCSSFAGTSADAYLDAFTLLSQRHLGPRRWLPRVKAPKVFRFADRLRARNADRRQAMLRMPPLLKTYLTMGGWVSDHAVVDDKLGTMHVFTGLEIGAIPQSRARLLRASML